MKKQYTATSVIRILFISIFFLSATILTRAQSNYVSTYAGSTLGYVEGDTSIAKFKTPFGMCADGNGNLFIADQTNNCIRKITPEGIVSTYAGTGTAGYLDGDTSIAQFNQPADVCADADGNIYVSDFANQYIRKISTDGMVSTIAGSGAEGYADGAAASAAFDYPRGICIDATGNLYIGDSWNHRIRKIDVNGNVSTYAGGGNIMGVQSVGDYADGNDTSARFYTPCGLAIDDEGNVYVADAYNHCVRKIDTARVVTTFAGIGSPGQSSGGYEDGAANTARFNTPTEVFADHNGNIYIGDTYNNRIREVSNGTVTTTAGNGISGLVNGIDTSAEFKSPRGMVLDAAGDHLFVCDNGNHIIRKITLNVETGILSLHVDHSSFTVYPNPASGYVFFSSSYADIISIAVYDMLGRKVMASNKPYAIDLSEVADGLYVLKVYDRNGKELYQTRVVKQR